MTGGSLTGTVELDVVAHTCHPALREGSGHGHTSEPRSGRLETWPETSKTSQRAVDVAECEGLEFNPHDHKKESKVGSCVPAAPENSTVRSRENGGTTTAQTDLDKS